MHEAAVDAISKELPSSSPTYAGNLNIFQPFHLIILRYGGLAI